MVIRLMMWYSVIGIRSYAGRHLNAFRKNLKFVCHRVIEEPGYGNGHVSSMFLRTWNKRGLEARSGSFPSENYRRNFGLIRSCDSLACSGDQLTELCIESSLQRLLLLRWMDLSDMCKQIESTSIFSLYSCKYQDTI